METNFLIIGAQKAGTTSIINYLSEHPDVFVPDDKEISCFYDDKTYNKRFNTYPYERYFSKWNGQQYAGNAPVNILYFAHTAAKKIYEYNHGMKLIALLRNPIDRLYSAYWFFVRCGLETKPFEAALKNEQYILQHGNFKELANYTYISHGFYCEQIREFMKYFDKNQLLVLLYDDFKIDPESTLKQIYQFLKIKESSLKIDLKKKYNVSSRSKIQSLHSMVYNENLIKYVYKKVLPEGLRHTIRDKIIMKLLNKNTVPFTPPPIHEETRIYLNNIFEAHNQKLEELLNRDLKHWLN